MTKVLAAGQLYFFISLSFVGAVRALVSRLPATIAGTLLPFPACALPALLHSLAKCPVFPQRKHSPGFLTLFPTSKLFTFLPPPSGFPNTLTRSKVLAFHSSTLATNLAEEDTSLESKNSLSWGRPSSVPYP